MLRKILHSVVIWKCGPCYASSREQVLAAQKKFFPEKKIHKRCVVTIECGAEVELLYVEPAPESVWCPLCDNGDHGKVKGDPPWGDLIVKKEKSK